MSIVGFLFYYPSTAFCLFSPGNINYAIAFQQSIILYYHKYCKVTRGLSKTATGHEPKVVEVTGNHPAGSYDA